MKKLIILAAILIFTVACQDNGSIPNDPFAEENINNDITTVDAEGATEVNLELMKANLTDSVSLTPEEAENLQFMREEEKLARDVYLAYYRTWDLHPFTRIARSENNHTLAIKLLLDKYGLTDPFIEEEGAFTNQDLKALYDQLILSGSDSLASAIYNALYIEEKDIADLEDAISKFQNEDLLKVYGYLLMASHNHLRAFYKVATRMGIEYTPTLITQEYFDEVVNSAFEHGKGRWRWMKHKKHNGKHNGHGKW